jgi:hypothetical protein
MEVGGRKRRGSKRKGERERERERVMNSRKEN